MKKDEDPTNCVIYNQGIFRMREPKLWPLIVQLLSREDIKIASSVFLLQNT